MHVRGTLRRYVTHLPKEFPMRVSGVVVTAAIALAVVVAYDKYAKKA